MGCTGLIAVRLAVVRGAFMARCLNGRHTMDGGVCIVDAHLEWTR